MAPTLWLIETRAAREYECPQCGEIISKGSPHYRHDPHPYSRQFRGDPTTHWCQICVLKAGGKRDPFTKRIRLPFIRKVGSMDPKQILYQIPKVEVLSIGQQLFERITSDIGLIYQISPSDFEDLVCDRLYAMGLEPKKVGHTNRKDGGIDILFWPRQQGAFPFLGAAQVKHHRSPEYKEGPSTVRDFGGIMGAYPLNAGLIVTNTSFTPDAKWYAKEHAKLVRLREFEDIQKWIQGNFLGNEEWREIPTSLELCPGLVIKLR